MHTTLLRSGVLTKQSITTQTQSLYQYPFYTKHFGFVGFFKRINSRLSGARVRTLSSRRNLIEAQTSAEVEMEITRSNFEASFPMVKQALRECQFYSFDCEMTGLFLEDRQSAYLDDIQDRYLEMLWSASRFVITQFGLSTFTWDSGQYRAKTFNFYLFPRPFDGYDKRFVCQSSSLDFLAGCGFDFNKFIYEGVSYMPVAMRNAKLAQMDRWREREDILITKPDDVALVKGLVTVVTEWLQGQEDTLVVPSQNSYQRAIQYQQLRRDQFGASAPPGFIVEKTVTEEGRTALLLRRASPEESKAWEQQQRELKLQAIHSAAGFAAVFEAMRDSGKPAVGHNLGFDLAYSLHSFARQLPGSWEEYKQLVAHWFPGGVWDTKLMAASHPGGLFEDTTLGVLHNGLLGGELQDRVQEFLRRKESKAGMGVGTCVEVSSDVELLVGADWELPTVGHALGFQRYEGADTHAYAHEAGYDAYMTGAAFCCLLRLYEAVHDAGSHGGVNGEGLGADSCDNGLAEEGSPSGAAGGKGEDEEMGAVDGCPSLQAVQQYKWKMNISRSDLPYAALQGPDPEPDRRHVFHLSDWPHGVVRHGGDIVRRLSRAGLGQLRATMVQGGQGALLEVADPEAVPRALDVLGTALEGWGVCTYAEYAARRHEGRQQQQPQSLHQGGGRDGGDGRGSRPQKRPRLEPASAQQGARLGPGSSRLGGRCSIM